MASEFMASANETTEHQARAAWYAPATVAVEATDSDDHMRVI